VNPLNDANDSLNGTNLLLTVPAGSSHDLWTGGDNTVRVVQSVANGDFLIQAKFDSSLAISAGAASQMQGILVEQDSSNFLRFDELAGWGVVRIFSGKILGGVASSTIDVGITPSYPIWLRVQRTGNTFTFSWSTNGTSFTTAGSFTQALTVNRVGLYGGNSGSPAPAFTASVDYFVSGRLGSVSKR
jgi:beta-xylosidase